jgi:hypothetical protein
MSKQQIQKNLEPRQEMFSKKAKMPIAAAFGHIEAILSLMVAFNP